MVFQNYALFPHMSVAKNIGFGLRMRGVSAADSATRVANALKLVQLTGQENKLPGQLSGGQQQRVAIARAIVIEPPLILMDEPLSNLDAKLRIETRAEIRRIQRELDRTTIYVTHDQDEALSLADRIVLIKDGIVQQIGTPSEVYMQPANLQVASFMGYRNVLELDVVREDGDRVVLKGKDIALTGVRKQPLTGARAMVAIRPEEISVGDGPGGVNTLEGRVGNVEYCGRDSLLDVITPAGTLLHVRGPVTTALNATRARPCAGRARAGLSGGLTPERAVTTTSNSGRLRAHSIARCSWSCRRRRSWCCSLSIPSSTGSSFRSTPKTATGSRITASSSPRTTSGRRSGPRCAWHSRRRSSTSASRCRSRIKMRVKSRYQRWVTTVLVVPITLGTVLIAEGMLTYFGPKGWLSHFLQLVHLYDGPIRLTHNYWGVLISLVISGFPFAFLLILSYITGIDPVLARAAATLGAGPKAQFRHIYLPLLAPGLAMCFCLAFVQAFSVFPSAILLGSPAGPTRVISIAAYEAAFEQYDYSLASAIAMIMGFVQLVIVAAVLGLRSAFYRGPVAGGKG